MEFYDCLWPRFVILLFLDTYVIIQNLLFLKKYSKKFFIPFFGLHMLKLNIIMSLSYYGALFYMFTFTLHFLFPTHFF